MSSSTHTLRRRLLGFISGVAALAGAAAAPLASADLLGVAPGLPLLNYNNTGTTVYTVGTSGSGRFVVDAVPIAVLFPGPVRRFVFSRSSDNVQQVLIQVQLNNAGALLGGVPGDDLVIIGKVDTTGDGIADADGVLLTGEVTEFGSKDSVKSSTDAYDFVFIPTGGALAPFYTGQRIGVTLTVEGTRSGAIPGAGIELNTISFAADFNGKAKGNIGPVPGVPDVELCKLVSLTGDDPFSDADDVAKAACDGFGTAIPVGSVGVTDASYQLLVINTGEETLVNATITDSALGLFDVPVPGGPIPAGGERLITETDPGFSALRFLNRCNTPGLKSNVAVVDAEGQRSGAPVSDADPANVRCVTPSITLLKEVSVDDGNTWFDANDSTSAPSTAVGGGALYRLTVTNDGTSDLVNVTLNDEELGIADFFVGNLAVNQTVVLGQGQIPALNQPGRCAAPGDVVNLAEVRGNSADDGQVVRDDDPAVVKCFEEDITLLKEVSVDGGVSYFDANDSSSAPATSVGGGALYRLTVTNSGTSTLENVVVNDTDLNIVDVSVGTLAPMQTVVLGSGQIPELAVAKRCLVPGDVTNIARVNAESRDTGRPVSDTDPAVVRCAEEDIQLLKEVSVDGGANYFDANDAASAPVAALGANALYRITVTNNGSSDLEDVVLNDAVLGITDFAIGDLAAGAFVVLTQGQIPELEVAQACKNPGDVTNIATVAGTSVDTGVTVSDSDPAQFRCVREDIRIVKEVSVDDGNTWVDANDSANAPATPVGGGALYRFTVTNTGTSDLEDVVVNDGTLGVTDFSVGDLAAGQSVVLTSGEIPQLAQPGRCQGPGDVTNVARVDGSSKDTGGTVSDTDPAVVRCVQEAITLLKEVSVDGGSTYFDANDAGSAPATSIGGGALYRLTVTNTGTTVLQGVVINDATLGIVNASVGTLAVGQTVVLDAGDIPRLEQPGRCATPGNVTNIATVSGTSAPTGNTVSASDPAVVRCVTQSIKLLKEVSVDGGSTYFDANDAGSAPSTTVGGGALYRLTVTNTGTSDLENVLVNDGTLGIADFLVGDLAASQSVILTSGEIPRLEQAGRCQAPGPVTNVANVTGQSADTGATVSDSDPAVVLCEQVAACDIRVEKTCVVEPPPPSGDLLCQSAISATTLRYTGPSMSNATVVFTGKNDGSATYTGVNLVSGVTVLSSGAQNGYTIDAGSGQGLGSKMNITINGVLEIVHTSCSAIYAAGAPAPLDGNTPNPPNSEKGDPSPNWFVVNFRDKDDAMVAVPDTTPPPGAESCTVVPTAASCKTLGKPSSLTFRYTGGGCPGANTQGSKTSCSGSVNGALPATVSVSTGDGYSVSPSTVMPGDLFTITRGSSEFRSNTPISLRNAGGTQSLEVHTSCSAPLATGDVFGAVTLLRFDGQGGGTDVIYRYRITNPGGTTVSVNSVFDDKLGELLAGGPQSLAPSGELVLSTTAAIAEETTNVVTVSGNVQGNSAAVCEAMDAVTVTVQAPPPPPVSCSDIKDITSLRLIWNGPSGVSAQSETGQVFSGVNNGDTILLDTPKDETGNDVDLFLSGAANGQSRFHISCSDSAMNGSEDCGSAQGNGKDNGSGLVNSWKLDGMTGQNGAFSCNTPGTTGVVLSGDYPGGSGGAVVGAATLDLDKDKIKWSLTNNSSNDVFITRVRVVWPSQHEKLKKFKLAGDFAKNVNDTTSPTTVPDEKAFESDANKRKLKAGDTENLEIEFDADYKNASQSQYSVEVTFDNGQVLTFN